MSIVRDRFIPGSPIAFEGDAARPVAGLWIEAWEDTVCGEPALLNIVFAIDPEAGELPQAVEIIAGTTQAGIELQLDAFDFAVGIAVAQIGLTEKNGDASAAECVASARIHNTVFRQSPPPELAELNVEGAWYEDWAVVACGRQIVVNMAFIPDGEGGTRFVSSPVAPPSKTGIPEPTASPNSKAGAPRQRQDAAPKN